MEPNPPISNPKSSIQLHIFRYTIVPANNTPTLFNKKLPNQKGVAIQEFIANLGKRKDFVYRNRTYALLGFTEYHEDESTYYVGQLAKKKIVSVGAISPNNSIVQNPTDDWNASWIVINIDQQYIAAECNSEFTPSNVSKSLKEIFDSHLVLTYNHTCFIKPFTQKDAFWDIVNNAEKIYSIKLSLISPNILDAEKNTRAVLDELQSSFNQQELIVSLKNSRGELKIDRNRNRIQGPISYIEEGEGTWETKTTSKGDTTATTRKSGEYQHRVEAEVPPAIMKSESLSEQSSLDERQLDARLISSVADFIKTR